MTIEDRLFAVNRMNQSGNSCSQGSQHDAPSGEYYCNQTGQRGAIFAMHFSQLILTVILIVLIVQRFAPFSVNQTTRRNTAHLTPDEPTASHARIARYNKWCRGPSNGRYARSNRSLRIPWVSNVKASPTSSTSTKKAALMKTMKITATLYVAVLGI